jgi:hypothetical protein
MAKSLKVLRAPLMRETRASCGHLYRKSAEIRAGSAGNRAGTSLLNNPIREIGETYGSPFSLFEGA